jgi:hypothetical protein
MNLSAIEVLPWKFVGHSLAPACKRGFRHFSSSQPGRSGSGGRKSKFLISILLLSPILANVGCQHIGPPTIEEDRLAYNKAISASWKQQILLNLVRIRNDDVVDFVDIGTASQNHTLTGTTQATLGASLLPWNFVGDILTPSLMGTRTTSDNPTITYAPQSGSDFIRNLNAPIKPYEIFNLIQGGYRADYVLNLTVKSIDDISKDFEDIDFENVANAIADANYYLRDVSFPIEVQPSSGDKKVFMIIPEKDSQSCEKCRRENPVAFIREKLRLRAAVTKFEIVPGTHHKENEIAVQTRSVISAMITLSQYVPKINGPLTDSKPCESTKGDVPLKVCIDSKRPNESYAAIKYRGKWFWIDWGDRRSNLSMVYLRTLLALADTGARPTAPVLTIPVSR